MGRIVLVCALVLVLFNSGAQARSWYIEADGTGDAPTIQAGIDSASTGDHVLLQPGIYTGAGNRDVDLQAKEIWVLGNAPEPRDCIIDCQGSAAEPHRAFFFDGEEGTSAGLSNVMIRNGYAHGGGAVSVEGGYLRIDFCVFYNNHSSGNGGAIYGTEIETYECSFASNSADSSGGAVSLRCGGQISKTWFSGNTAYEGGAIAFSGAGAGGVLDPDIIQTSSFDANQATLNGDAIIVGGGGTDLRVNSSVFCSNEFQSPGRALIGLASWSPDRIARLRIAACTIVANGGGIEEVSTPPPTIESTLIAYNKATIDGCAELSCCDIWGNSSGDWVGCIADQRGIRGNFSAYPGLCIEPPESECPGIYGHICDDSYLNYGNHPYGADCDLIGAWGMGCTCTPTATEPSSWGGIKSIYR